MPEVTTLRSEFKDIALKFPGFAGLWLDETGSLVVNLSEPDALTPAMREALEAWLDANGKHELTLQEWGSRVVSYDFATLVEWLDLLRPSVVRVDGVNSLGVDVRRASVLIGIDMASRTDEVRAVAAGLGIPDDALSVEVHDERDSQLGLRNQFISLGGGIQIQRTNGSFCSIGFVGFQLDSAGNPDWGRRVFTTAAHCTPNQRTFVFAEYNQAVQPRRVGELLRVATVYQGGCPNGYVWCRYADAALVLVDDSIGSNFGQAAKSQPTSPQGNPNPPFLGWNSYSGSGVTGHILPGEIVTKVGSTTGQTSGSVNQVCVDRQSGTTGIWTLCANRALATASYGDSGGPVYVPFSPSGTLTPRAIGVLFQGATNSLWYSPAGFLSPALGYDLLLYW